MALDLSDKLDACISVPSAHLSVLNSLGNISDK